MAAKFNPQWQWQLVGTRQVAHPSTTRWPSPSLEPALYPVQYQSPILEPPDQQAPALSHSPYCQPAAPTVASPQVTHTPLASPQRKILARAVQACERCRSRRQKCDEGRPCSTCQKDGHECSYEKGKGTKLDKDLLKLSESLEELKAGVQALLHSHGLAYPTLLPPRATPGDGIYQTEYGGDGGESGGDWAVLANTAAVPAFHDAFLSAWSVPNGI